MSGGEPLPVSRMETQKVTEVQFEIFKSTQLKKAAVCCVSEAKSYVNGRPSPGGISDLRMGSTDFEFACETCSMPHPHCPGHFGYMELAEPLFNIGVFDFVLQALRCVCKCCGALLVSLDEIPKEVFHRQGVYRLREILKLCGGKTKCRVRDDGNGGQIGCDQTQVKVRKQDGLYPKLVILAIENEVSKRWYGEEVRAVLDKISDEDAIIMGFKPQHAHPRDLLISVLPVPPPQVRPTVSFGSAKSDNELSHKLISILKENDRLAKAKEATAGRETVNDIRELLQEHVATYFHNTSTYYKPARVNSKVAFKSISERLKGKYGRLRGNLMGKRVDFSARTVITGDPNIDVDEVGVPRSIAMCLSFPERVNALNKKRLQDTVRRTDYPSASHIFHPNGMAKKLGVMREEARKKLTVNIGDVVERNIMDGDVVLFNRQPTLHRMSMMGHRARILPFNTFRLNLSCTTPYNADFDGDEMNLHVPQSLLSKAELMEMMMVPKNFVSPNKSMPCMGIVQDSLLGLSRMTNRETFLDKYFMQNLAMWVVDKWDVPIPAILKPEPLWTGKQVFSMVMPEVTYFVWDKNHFSDEDKSLVIRRGKLLSGSIKKSHVGVAAGSLIHVIFNEKGSDAVATFINGVQRTTSNYLYKSSFSVGIQDTVADKATLNRVNEILADTRNQVSDVAAKANEGSLKRKAGMTLMQSFEAEVNSALNQCREDCAQHALKAVKRTNNFKGMIDCGSKGTHLNICQIAVMVGQQNVGGARIPFSFRRRTLPHFVQDDYGEKSRGMVNRGFLEGLRPEEFFFHTMGGREGLIDTAVKTADTGYLQRKLIKALEDVSAQYDGTVRNAAREVVQFMYGEDGLDGQRIEQNQVFDIVWKDDAEMRDRYRFEYNDDGSQSEQVGGDYMASDVKRMLRQTPQHFKPLEAEFLQLVKDRENARKWMDIEEPLKLSLPINVERLIANTQAQFEVGRPQQRSNLSPIDIIRSVTTLLDQLRQFFPSYNKGPNGTFTSHHSRQRVEDSLQLFGIHVRSMLSSKRVIRDYRLNDKAFEHLLGEIRLKYLQSTIKAGEMVGAIAAQSCGEPATQMTLNTFHNAGISSKNVTLGVPRLQELLNVSRTQKNSSVTIALLPGWTTREKAQDASNIVEYATLETVTRKLQIIYDPNPRETVVAADREFVEADWDPDMWPDDLAASRQELLQSCSPWVARLTLDDAMFFDKKLRMNELCALIEEAAPQVYHIEASQSAIDNRVLRLRLRKGDASADMVTQLKTEVPQLLQKVHLRGIKGVTRVLTQEVERYPIDPETGKMKKTLEWALDTEGTSLKIIMGQTTDLYGNLIVDGKHTASNNIPEIYTVLGVEAARRKLFTEMRMAYMAYGVVINYRHYSVLIDTMCHRGYLMAVSRVGINRSGAGPMMCSSFEETVKVLMQAAAFGESDPVVGVSANITLGSQSKVGTGSFDVMLNVPQLRDAVPQEEAVKAGAEPNVYHGASSIMNVGSTVPDTFAAHATHTPVVADYSQKFANSGSVLSLYNPTGSQSTTYGTSLNNGSTVHQDSAPSVAYSMTSNAAADLFNPVSSSAYPTYGGETSAGGLGSQSSLGAAGSLASTGYGGLMSANYGRMVGGYNPVADNGAGGSSTYDGSHVRRNQSSPAWVMNTSQFARPAGQQGGATSNDVTDSQVSAQGRPYQPQGMGMGSYSGGTQSIGSSFDPLTGGVLGGGGSTPYVPQSAGTGYGLGGGYGSMPFQSTGVAGSLASADFSPDGSAAVNQAGLPEDDKKGDDQ